MKVNQLISLASRLVLDAREISFFSSLVWILIVKVDQLNTLIQKPVFRHITGVAGANILNNLSSFAIIISAARLLSPSEFAKLTLVFSISNNLASVLDFDSQTTFLRFYSLTESESQRAGLIHVILRWKFFLLMIAGLIALPASQFIKNCFPILENSSLLVCFSIITGGLLCVWITIRGIEQAQRDFKSFSMYTILYGFLRLIVAALFVIFHQISTLNILISLSIAPLALLILYKLFKGFSSSIDTSLKENQLSWKDELKILKPILNYCLWAGSSAVLFTITYQIPQYILAARSSNSNEIALYGSALTFIPIFLLANEAIRTVLVPDIAAIQDADGRQKFRNQLFKLAPVYFGSMSICLVAIAALQYILLGSLYRDSVPVFLVLGVSLIIMIYIGLANALIHSFGTPKVMTIGNAIRALSILFFCLLLPNSALFMSSAFGIVMISVELFIFFILRQRDINELYN